MPAKPLAFSPVTLNKHPAAGCSSSTEAVVTYKTSKFGPPNVHAVICFAGNEITSKICPLL